MRCFVGWMLGLVPRVRRRGHVRTAARPCWPTSLAGDHGGFTPVGRRVTRACAIRRIRRRSRRSSPSCALQEMARTAAGLRGLIVILWRVGLRIQEAWPSLRPISITPAARCSSARPRPLATRRKQQPPRSVGERFGTVHRGRSIRSVAQPAPRVGVQLRRASAEVGSRHDVLSRSRSRPGARRSSVIAGTALAQRLPCFTRASATGAAGAS